MIVSLIIDIVMAGLMGVTIYFCWRLNGYMKILRDSRSELALVIHDFNNATAKAQASIQDLKSASETIADKLQVKIEKAEFMADDLAYIIEKSNKVADNLSNHLSEALAVKPKASPKDNRPEPKGVAENIDVLPPIRPSADKQQGVEALSKKPTPPVADEGKKPRSKAEIELLQALKSIR